MEKTAQEIDAMSSAEYAKYIKYNRTQPAAVAVAPEGEIDPSMPARVPVAAPAPTVAVTPEPVAPPAPVEKRFEYQNKDEHGRPIGGKQVIVYTDEADMQRKFAEKEQNLVRHLREVTRKQRLGITDNEEALVDAEFVEVPEFRPRELTPEERFQLSQDINDPAKAIDAVNTMIEASVGMSPAKLRETTAQNTFTLQQLTAKSNYDTFEKGATDFYPCSENKQALIEWMVKTKLQPSIANFQKAQSTLSRAGLLVDRPIVQEVVPTPAPVAASVQEPNSQVPVVPESRIAPEEQPQTKRQVKVSSGLSEANSSTTNSAAQTVPMISVTLAEIERMPSEQYKRWLKDPANKAIRDEIDRQGQRRS
jgi:hypothetical protein